MPCTVPLSEIRLADAGQVGGKAAVLGELAAAGFPVPPGFAVTTAAAAARAVPDALAAELAEALARLGGGPVAVRSSAVGEDGALASFAGMYATVLNVTGLPGLLAAIQACWRSGQSPRVAAYGPGGPVGVLVQRMVAAGAAGAAFSVNPVTGDTGERLVSAVRGLGDRLMAGQAAGEEWAARDGAVELRSGPGGVLSRAQASEVVALTERVAAHFGTPQDIEWAIAGDTLWLVQARPVTALRGSGPAAPLRAEPPPGFWTRGPGSDLPVTPLQRSVYLPVLARHLGQMFAFGVLGFPAVTEIGGWVYLRMDFGSEADRAVRAERAGAAVARGEPEALIRRWHQEWKPAFAARLAVLRGHDLTSLNDEQVTARFRELTALFAALHGVYFQLTGASACLFGQLGLACQDLLGWSAEQATRLRGGLRGDHMAAIVALADLARMAAQRPAVAAELRDADSGSPGRLAGLDPEFAAKLAAYTRDYAHRTSGFDLSQPTLAEQPLVVLGLLRAQLGRPFDLAAEQAALDKRLSAVVSAAQAGLAGRPVAERERFRALLAANDAGTGVRDEKVYYAVSAWALLRYAAQELGRRLADRGQLGDAGDVLFLTDGEALDALATGASQSALAARRRAEHAWAGTQPGPPSYGTPPAGPPVTSLEPLSPQARTVVRVAGWVAQLWGGRPPARDGGDDGVLRGTGACAGRYTGPARIIRNVAEFAKVRQGDVLVCPETTAQWAVLFPSIGALVSDTGGLLSHPAIIAREYGVPAVIAAGVATTRLRDGELVTVDGSAGTVRPATGAFHAG
ncbi:MAG TPA: PEP/pyruvate-binding domain-containing protein [Streptosporangiaceae bacterium]|jgi:pyruvate,water dikinase